MFTVKLFSLVKASFSFWNAFYLLAAGAAILAYPTYLYRNRPDSPVLKYTLLGAAVLLVAFINVAMAKVSDSNFLNYFWVIIFSTLYFNKKTVLIVLGSAIMSYLFLVLFIPVVRPAGFQSYQSAVLTRIFYLCIGSSGCIAITTLANHLLKRIGEQEQVTQIAFNNINSLLSSITATGMTLASSSHELAATTEETSASIQETSGVVVVLTDEARKTREEMSDTRQLLESLAERAVDHQDLTKRTMDLTGKITTMAAQGSETALLINQTVAEVVRKFELTFQTIKGLDKDSQSIRKIVQNVTDIVEQTKLLSINASIEAAHAGEYGKGFALVASEIGKLSDRTQETVNQIEAIIDKFLPQLESTVAHSQETAVLFDRGIKTVLSVNDTFTQIVTNLKGGLPLLHNVAEFLKSQAGTIQEIEHKVTAAYQFSQNTESGMQNLNHVLSDLSSMAQFLTTSSQQMSLLAQTLTEQASTNQN
ncbi:MAG TPA: methyl-accepting chemotaxis protein [Bacillota bacterium]|nr:methyl-accepting chemotaxis protein [Bacillota bacterium]